MSEISIAFGRRVAELRKKKGWTQLDLSLKANIAKSYLSELETGKRNPTLKEINKLAYCLGVSLSALFEGI